MAKHDYTKMTTRDVVLIIAERTEDLPERVSKLENKWAWLTGVGSAIMAALGLLEARHH